MAATLKKIINTDGTIAWRTRVALPPGPDGQRRQRWLTAPTKKALEAKAAETIHGRNTGTLVETSPRLTTGQWLAEWLARRKPVLAPGTYDNYAYAVEARWTPAIGTVPLLRLGPDQIEATLACWLTAGLSAATVENYRVVLAVALKAAVRLRKLTASPMQGVQTPRRRAPVVRAWTEADMIAFLTATRDTPDYPLWLTALTTGLRQGELLALSWSSVDLETGRLTVCQALRARQRAKHGGTFAGDRVSGHEIAVTKTDSSVRTITLLAGTVDALRLHRDRCRFEYGTLPDFVWCQAGHPDQPPPAATMGWRWRKAVKAAGIPYISPHGTRKTHATLALVAGVPLQVVQARLGHRTPKTLLAHYAAVTTAMEERTAAVFDGMLTTAAGGAR